MAMSCGLRARIPDSLMDNILHSNWKQWREHRHMHRCRTGMDGSRTAGSNADDSTASTTATSTDGQPQQRNEKLLVETCLNNLCKAAVAMAGHMAQDSKPGHGAVRAQRE